MTHTATRFAPRGADTFRIQPTASGFDIVTSGAHGSHTTAVHWSEVARIDAYQRDQFRKNVFLVLQLKDGSRVELNEDLPGWSDLVAELPKALPGCLARGDWWRGSAGQSEADLNWRTIYYRYSISGMGSR